MKSKFFVGLIAFALSSSLFAVRSIDVQFDLKNMANRAAKALAGELNKILILTLSLPDGEPYLCHMSFVEMKPMDTNMHVWSKLNCSPHQGVDAPQEELTLVEMEKLLHKLSIKAGIEMIHARIIKTSSPSLRKEVRNRKVGRLF